MPISTVELGQTDPNTRRWKMARLKLTYAFEKGEKGSMIIDDLGCRPAMRQLHRQFKLFIGGGNGADGFSFNFAPDLPDAPFGQEGDGTGLTVAFDTYDNGGGEAPASTQVGRIVVQHKKVTGGFLRANQFVDVVIEAKTDGSMDVTYGTNVVYTNVFAYVPISGRFGVGAATGGSHDNHWVDDLNITTTPLAGPTSRRCSRRGRRQCLSHPSLELQDVTTQVNDSTVTCNSMGRT